MSTIRKSSYWFILLLIISSCSSRLQEKSEDVKYQGEFNKRKFYNYLPQEDTSKKTFKIRFSGTWTRYQEKTVSFTATLRLQKDSAAVLSFYKAKILVFRLHLTPEKVVSVDYVKKEYQEVSYEDIDKVFPMALDYRVAQHLLLYSQAAMIKNKWNDWKYSYRYFEGKTYLSTLKVRKQNKIEREDSKKKAERVLKKVKKSTNLPLYMEYVFDKSLDILQQKIVDLDKQRELLIRYFEIGIDENYVYPSRSEWIVSEGGVPLHTLTLKVSNIHYNEEFNLELRLPRKYKKIDL